MSFIHQDILIELLDKASKERRKELLDDLQYDTSNRSFPKLVNIRDIPIAHDHILSTEYDHRNLETEIDGANDPCHGLSQLNRQLTQEGDMRVMFNEEKTAPIKIVKKRSSECRPGVETYKIKDKNGDDVSLQADDILFKGEPQIDSEDIYDQCEKIPHDLVTSRYIPPMDTWDVIYDATEAVSLFKQACLFLNDKQKGQTNEEIMKDIRDTIYTSNIYPELRDKRYSNRLMEKLLMEKDLPGNTLMKVCGASRSMFQEKIESLTKQANALPPGKEKARLMVSIQEIKMNKTKKMKESVSISNKVNNLNQLKLAERFPFVINEDRKKTKEETRESINEIKEIENKLLLANRKINQRILSGNRRTTIPCIDRKVMWNMWNEININRRKATEGRFKVLLKKKLLKKMSEKMKEMSFKNSGEKRQQAILFQAYICNTINRAVSQVYGNRKSSNTKSV